MKIKNTEIEFQTCQDGYYQKDKGQQVLARMWRKNNTGARLLRMLNGAPIMENSMEVPQKIENRTTI